MKKKLKRKWVKALRSGEYCQTEGSLIDEKGYCCLGVLCDVMGIAQDEDENFVDEDGRALTSLGSAHDDGEGLSGLVMKGGRWELAKMNDHGATFDEIADWIEENL